MDKQAFLNLIDDSSSPKEQKPNQPPSQIINYVESNVIGIQNNIYHTDIDTNENLTEDNKREIRAMIDKFEKQNRQRGGQSANDD